MDLKLLTVFDEIYKTRSVSRAGENLGVAQSSVSISLARLRRHFGDPLFVRTADGMQPTPHATSLVAPGESDTARSEASAVSGACFAPGRCGRRSRRTSWRGSSCPSWGCASGSCSGWPSCPVNVASRARNVCSIRSDSRQGHKEYNRSNRNESVPTGFVPDARSIHVSLPR